MMGLFELRRSELVVFSTSRGLREMVETSVWLTTAGKISALLFIFLFIYSTK